MNDELAGATIIQAEGQERGNDHFPADSFPDKEQMAEFSTSIQDIMDKDAPQMNISSDAPGTQGPVPKWAKKYPLGLNYKQVEALIAGLAGVLGTSEAVQSKLASSLPQFYSDSGKISMTGMAVMALVVAVIFYFAKQFLLK